MFYTASSDIKRAACISQWAGPASPWAAMHREKASLQGVRLQSDLIVVGISEPGHGGCDEKAPSGQLGYPLAPSSRRERGSSGKRNYAPKY